MTTLRDRAAKALDMTHAHAAQMIGIHTDRVRDLVAAWLDGQKMKTSLVRKSISYLEMIGRS